MATGLIPACNSNSKNQSESKLHTEKQNNMNLLEHVEIKEIIKRLESGMLDYMTTGMAGYTKTDVEKCMKIISDYLLAMGHATSKDEGMSIVKEPVLSLNQLNESSGENLIETDQREDIAEIIILAGSLKGFNERREDITEAWREW